MMFFSYDFNGVLIASSTVRRNTTKMVADFSQYRIRTQPQVLQCRLNVRYFSYR